MFIFQEEIEKNHFAIKQYKRCTGSHFESVRVQETLQHHREEIYREETRGKLCHADIFILLTIENYINSLFY